MIADPGLTAARSALLDWYARERRDLPWRRTENPWHIWVSEVMLQQTQVATVIPYYERFVARFPDPSSLAAAGEEEVLALWAGLGYYTRARALRSAARVVVERHSGSVPGQAWQLAELPGIGRYTAGAIASIAFAREEPVLDGNVRRVLSRFDAIDGRTLGRSAEERALWDLATRLVAGPSPGELNQALMELGATVCSPRRPDCPRCPIASCCKAQASAEPERYPAPRPRRATERVAVAAAWIEDRGRVLVESPGAASPLRGHRDLPAFVLGSDAGAGESIESGMRLRHGLDALAGELVGSARHSILQRRLTIEVHRCHLRSRDAAAAGIEWIAIEKIYDAAVSGATRKISRLVLAADDQPLSARAASGRGSHGRRSSSSSGTGSGSNGERPSRSGKAPRAESTPAQ